MLEIQDVRVHYRGALALDGITLTVRSGEAVSIIGPNGAGKTSLLRAISGLVPYQGEIRYEGRSLRGVSPAAIVRAGVVHCPEAGQLFGEMSVQENLEMGAYTIRDRQSVRTSLDQVFTLFPQLADRRRQRAATLSGGERQMLAIGRSLMSRPRLIMLDEPSLGLAPGLRDRISERIGQIHREWGLTVILVEQDSTLALSVGERVCVLDGGRIVKEGTAESISQDPSVREVYLGIG